VLNPIRAFRKLVIDPLRYRGKDGYDAARYWSNRHSKYGVASLRGSGDEGRSEDANAKQYASDLYKLGLLLKKLGVSMEGRSVLDVGCGAGVYATYCRSHHVRSYLGTDITDVLFPRLLEEFPDYRFVRHDCTSGEPLPGEWDMVLMIDVVEHITSRRKLIAAIRNLSLVSNTLIVGPVWPKPRKRMFYLRDWTETDVIRALPDRIIEVHGTPFRGGRLLAISTG